MLKKIQLFIFKCQNIIENAQIMHDNIIPNLALNLVEQQTVLEKFRGKEAQ